MQALSVSDLVAWFCRKKRPLPWRENPNSYSVWVSEVMLQQTQVSRALLYFQRWMKLFPTVKALAESREEEVMKAWEGLGYYSRARALRKGAQYIQEVLGGVIPSEREALLSIPGIGEYTQGAIRSFAFHEKASAIDANVLRVLARLYDLPLEQGASASYKRAGILVEKLLPKEEPWVVMEALIELGALVCGKKPRCAACPLQKGCLAFVRNTVEERPILKKPLARIHEKRMVFVFEKKTRVCVVKRKGKGVMSGLWEFPYCPYEEEALEQFDCSCLRFALDSLQHSYTRYSVTLYPYIFHMPDTFSWHEGEWIEKEMLSSLAFSSGHRKILCHIREITS